MKTFSPTSVRALAIIICAMASFFYLYDFAIRVMPAAMTNELMQIFNIGSPGVGILASLFFYGYLIVQIPGGLLLDKFGPRKIITSAFFVSASTTFLFLATPYFAVAGFARFFMGLSAGFAYIGALLLVSRWFSAKYFALLAGSIQIMGCIGAIIGEAPFATMIAHIGPIHAINIIAAIGLIATILFWFIIKDFPPGQERLQQIYHDADIWMKLKSICKNNQTWCIGTYALLCWSPISVFASLWGVPYFMNIYHISAEHAGYAVAMIWIGMAMGGPIFGAVSNAIQLRKLPLLFASVLGVIGTLSIIFPYQINFYLMHCFLFLFGVAGSAPAITFGLVQDINHPRCTATASGFNNMAMIIGGATFQLITSILLQRGWHGEIIKGHPFYSTHDFQHALIILPACYFLSFFVGLFLIKETSCRPIYKTNNHRIKKK
jgi:MFS family permease